MGLRRGIAASKTSKSRVEAFAMKHDTAKLSPSILGAWISIQKMFENKSDPLDLMKTQRKRRKKKRKEKR
jgi:hypothetical protein